MIRVLFLIAVTLSSATAKAEIPQQEIEPYAGSWKTWVLSSGSYFRLPAPPNRAATKTEVKQLEQIAANLTADDLVQVNYWNTSSPAYRWIQIARQEIDQHNPPGPMATRDMALVAAAIYDATLAVWDTKYAYQRHHPSQVFKSFHPLIPNGNSPSYPSEHAATAAATAAVLTELFPQDAAKLADLAAKAEHSRLASGTEFPSDVSGGVELGVQVAQQVIAYARRDGSDVPWTGSIPPGPGVWNGTNPVFPLAGQWKPWVLSSGAEFRLGPPPAYNSPERAHQIQLIEDLVRTPAVIRTAWVWQAGFIDPLLDTINQELFETRLDLNAPRAARAYALAAIAEHDASIACWDTKYTYWEQRPNQADPNFKSIIPTPSHPSWPSGHACGAGGADAVLEYLFPADAMALAAKTTEAGESTFYGGVHFQSDVDAGLSLGRTVGQRIVIQAKQDGS